MSLPQILSAAPGIGGVQLYHGLDASESARPGQGLNPFMFLGMGF